MSLHVRATGDGASRGAAIGRQLAGSLVTAWDRWCDHFTAKGIDPQELADRLVGVPGWDTAQRLLPDRKSTRLNSSHTDISRMPSSA